MYKYTQVCTAMYKSVLTARNMQKYVAMSNNMEKYERICTNMYEYAQIFPNMCRLAAPHFDKQSEGGLRSTLLCRGIENFEELVGGAGERGLNHWAVLYEYFAILLILRVFQQCIYLRLGATVHTMHANRP